MFSLELVHSSRPRRRRCLLTHTLLLVALLAATFINSMPPVYAVDATMEKAICRAEQSAVANRVSTPCAGEAKAFAFDELGAAVDEQNPDSPSGIRATATGAEVQATFQDLTGQVTTEGLWLHSTADDAPRSIPFRVMATSIGREFGPMQPLAATGTVQVTGDRARWLRPGIVEEYLANTDGVRQDFLVANRPAGTAPLHLALTVTGATVTGGGESLTIQLAGSGRQLAYSRLHVTDATGRTLPAQFQTTAVDRITLVVDDQDARWPLRIDPTFSDADWVSMGVLNGTNNSVRALAVSGSDLYVGGAFSTAGGVSASRIAKWNGSSWSALGTGLNSTVNALAVSGSDLYVGGGFTTAGEVSASRIAKWNGSSWSALGTGLNSTVNALAVSGSDLYVGGAFSTAGGVSASNIAKWNGSSWSALGTGTNNSVNVLAVSGSDLYVGGAFSTAGGVSASRIAKWNGSSWSALGTGMNSSTVNALAVSGSDLYVGGAFTTAGGVSASRIAKWNGSTWSALGTGLDSTVNALAVSGSDLYVGGDFTTAGGVSASRIAKWNGSSWSALGTGMNGTVRALAVSGSDLYVGGSFTTAGGVSANFIAKWNGSSWSALGANTGVNDSVYALAVSGSDLYVGGTFTTAGGVSASRIAKWNGSSWSALGANTGVNDSVYALAVSGSDLYVGGAFSTAGGISASRIAKWNGSSWSALGTGLNNTVFALAVSGSDLYVGGAFTSAGGVSVSRIAKWNGSSWSALGTGLNNTVFALAVSGSDLYVGGDFTAGGVSANYIAKWNGSTWSALGTGLDNIVFALAVSGSDLYVGGDFTTAGGVSANYIAKWNGSSWSALGTGMNSTVSALAVSGSDLYVGGIFFTTTGGISASRIAKWNGSTWSALGTGLNSSVNALAVSGSDLYVGGDFTTAGGKASAYAAKATFPEIDVLGNNVSIVNGDNTPSTADGTDFGTVAVNSGTAVRTFTIQNTGTGGLALDGSPLVAVSGANASDFTLTTLPATSVAAGGSTTFQITFDPSVGGARTATLTIVNNDSNEGSYTFAISGSGTTPEIDIQGNSISIVSGDITPSATDHTDFGSGAVSSGTVVRTFTIHNTGDAALTLSGAPLVAVGGTNANDFTVTTLPATSVAASDSTTFQLTFDPSAAGARTATVTIANNDSDEGSYTFAIQGTGVVPNAQLNGVDCDLIDAINAANTDTATGSCPAGNGADTITLLSDVTLSSAYNSSANGLPVISSELTIEGSEFTIARSSADQFRILEVAGGGNLTLNEVTITGGDIGGNGGGIANAYNATLRLTNSTVSGNSATGRGGGIDNDSGSVTLENSTVSNNSGSSGGIGNTGTLELTNSVIHDNVATNEGGGINNFATGMATLTNSTVRDNEGAYGAGINNSNGGSVTLTNSTVRDNSAVAEGGGIRNTGGEVTLNGSTVSGNSAEAGGGLYTNFDNTSLTNSTVSGNTAQNGGGIYSVNLATVDLANSTVTGNTATSEGDGIYSEGILLLNRSLLAGNGVPDGSEVYKSAGTVTAANFNLFGYAGNAGTVNFTPSGSDIVPSQGLATILNTTLADNGGGTQTHALVTGSPAIDAAGDSGLATDQRGTTRPQGCADDIGAFELTGVTCAVPEIDVQGNSVSIASGDTTPGTPDGTDFGSMDVSSGTVVRTFTIRNTGTGALTLSSPTPVSVSGTNAGDFTITQPSGSSIAAGGSATFQLTFDPSAVGLRTATVTIANNDSDEGSYTFAIQGTGATKVTSQIGQLSFSKVSSTTTPDSTYPAQSTAGVLVARLSLKNNGGNLNNLYFRVNILNNNNWLLNADSAPGQVGSRLTVPNSALPVGNIANVWENGETFNQDFRIGVMVAATVQFKVDVYAATGVSTMSAASQGDELLGSYYIELDPTALDAVHIIYLPAVSK